MICDASNYIRLYRLAERFEGHHKVAISAGKTQRAFRASDMIYHVNRLMSESSPSTITGYVE